MKNIGLKEKAKVIDLTRKVGTVETLTEARINCAKEEKVRLCLYMSCIMRENRLFAYAKTKTQISCAVTAQLISAFVFATWISKSEFSSY